MAAVNGDSDAVLATKMATPIAQLNPDLPDQASRAVRGDITITWPYNSVTKKLAFLIAEPDVRLRRSKGQIRIELHGPSAKAASECGLGAGDELLFSLEGVEWSKDESPGRIPGARVEWQLQFNQKLNLQVKFGESGEVKHINIDHSTSEQPDGPAVEAPRAATPDPEPAVYEMSATARKISDLPPIEYPSPAFVKRARLSYGALFEDGFDIFEEDGGIKGKGRKRTRFGRDSSAWRYTSQSPSPEPTSPAPDAMEEDVPGDVTPQPSPKPQMMDEGCQTVELEMTPAPNIVDAIPSQREATPTPAPRERPAAPAQKETAPVRESHGTSASPIPREEPVPEVPTQTVAQPEKESSSIAISAPLAEPREQSPKRPVEVKAAQEQPSTTIPQTSPPPAGTSATVTSTLFGPKPLASTFSSFGASAPARVESALSLADQVRFGFSHVPQTTRSPSPARPEPAPQPDYHAEDAYPASYLDAPDSAKYAEMNTHVNAADEQHEMAVHGHSVPPQPPAIEHLGDGRWEMSTQAPQYNPIEGGHFGADALDEGTRVMAEQPSLHADELSPDRVPEGFASYGHEDVPERPEDSPPRQEVSHEDQPLVENEDTISGDEVGLNEEEDEDERFDEYAYGERIEEGDYDQRNYDSCSDDEEGLSQEEDEVELEAEERYGNGGIYDEDGEGEEWDEEEEYESEEDYDEEDEEMGGYRPAKPAAPAPTGEPVVISLLSDSEDEEPAPPPKKPAPAPRAPNVPEPPSSPKKAPSPVRYDSPGILETVEKEEAESAEQDHRSNDIFGRTHVVDFAERHAATQRLRVPQAEMDTAAGSSSPADQETSSFKALNARDNSFDQEPEPAPSQGSSDGLFVSQSKPQSAPSESSSEGLFISQPRARSHEAEDQRTDDGSTDGGTDLELEQARTRDEESSVIEMEEDDTTSPSFVSRDDDADMADASGVSFASQVDMEDELAESEDESMSADDAPSKSRVGMDVTWSSFEIEEVTSSAGDVDMLDVGSAQFESASPEAMPRSPWQETSPAASEVVITEVVMEASVSGAEEEPFSDAEEPIPSVETPVQQEAGSPTPAAEEREPASAERPLEKPGVPDALTETREAEGEGQEELASKPGVLPVPADELEDESVAEVQKQAEDATTEPVDEAVPSPEPQQEISDDSRADGKAIDGPSTARFPEVAAATGAHADGVTPDSSVPAQPPTVVRLDEGDSEDEPVLLSSQAEEDRGEQTADGAEGSPQQMKEPETAQQLAPPEDDMEDDVLILEQLTQEQQQYPEEAADIEMRTPSPSADISVQLAHQAVAAKRPKKAAEPSRTSPRITRARSSSLRSNTTNGSPEQEEDTSVSLARAALASPSKQEEDPSVTLARAALSSPSKHAAEPDGTTTPIPTTKITSRPPQTITTLKSDLAKRLHTDLPECVPLKSLSKHVDKFPNAIAVVTSQPTQPTRAKGGPREYFMSFHVTDPSAAPSTVVEVQLYRPHKDSLPVVKPGDVILLQRFQVKALSKKGWGLRTGVESAWAVWDGGLGDGDGDGESQLAAPQIRGPPVEDWEGCVEYVRMLREWFGLVMGDEGMKGKLERADRKLMEAGGGGK